MLLFLILPSGSNYKEKKKETELISLWGSFFFFFLNENLYKELGRGKNTTVVNKYYNKMTQIRQANYRKRWKKKKEK